MKPQILSDGITVWVNAANGMCIGRFGRNGIDVHTAELDAGKECLHCTHEPTTPEDWEIFKQKMLEHHNVTVPDKHIPKRFLHEKSAN